MQEASVRFRLTTKRPSVHIHHVSRSNWKLFTLMLSLSLPRIIYIYIYIYIYVCVCVCVRSYTLLSAIHDFNTRRPPSFTCCEPNCRRTFAAEDPYRAHWIRDHHGDRTPNDIADIHLLLINPKGRHAARCFLAIKGGGEPINSIR